MYKTFVINLFSFLFVFNWKIIFCIVSNDVPTFGTLMSNLSVTIGRDAVITCVVENLSTYKVAWLRVDTQTILTIQTYVITKNHRIRVVNNDNRTWKLHILNIINADRGWYMCQINTDPMKSQTAYLEVVAPPDILDYATSSEVVANEGHDVSLKCKATGFPLPVITWRREDGYEIFPNSSMNAVTHFRSISLDFKKVRRKHSGIYLCIASNGIPPTVSKRISLIIQYIPEVYIQKSVLKGYEGTSLTLQCKIEAYPKPSCYWILNTGQIITDTDNENYSEVFLSNFIYKVNMKLVILDITAADFGTYSCVAKNSLGASEGLIQVHRASETEYTQWITDFNNSKNIGILISNNSKLLIYIIICIGRAIDFGFTFY